MASSSSSTTTTSSSTTRGRGGVPRTWSSGGIHHDGRAFGGSRGGGAVVVGAAQHAKPSSSSASSSSSNARASGECRSTTLATAAASCGRSGVIRTTTAGAGRGGVAPCSGARQRWRRSDASGGGNGGGNGGYGWSSTGTASEAAAGEGRRGMAFATRAAGDDSGSGVISDEKKEDGRRTPPSSLPPAPTPSPKNNNNNKKKKMNPKRIASPQFSEEAQTWALLGGVATFLTIIVTLFVAANDEAAYFGGGPDDFSYMGDDYGNGGGLFVANVSPGTALAAAIWSFGLFFKSPLQILLVFLGRTDTERPSDWMLRKFAPGSPKTFEDAPGALKAATLAFFVVCGVGITAGFDALFAGEETWGLSAGIGFTMLSFVAELGSPQRYTRSELDVLEAQYEDFVSFADDSLQRRGRCHSTEVSRAFRRRFPRYSDDDVLSDKDLRTMILNWHPNAERTNSGYYKNLSLQGGVDQRSAVTLKDLGL